MDSSFVFTATGRAEHPAVAELARLQADIEALRELEAGTREVVHWRAGDVTAGYCGKACKYVTKTVNPLNWNAPDRLAVYCSTSSCSCSMKVSDLPKRYRVTEDQFRAAAAKALRALLAEPSQPDTEGATL